MANDSNSHFSAGMFFNLEQHQIEKFCKLGIKAVLQTKYISSSMKSTGGYFSSISPVAMLPTEVTRHTISSALILFFFSLLPVRDKAAQAL